MSKLCVRLLDICGRLEKIPVGHLDLTKDVLDGTEKVRRASIRVDELLVHPPKASFVTLPRLETRLLWREHERSLNRSISSIGASPEDDRVRLVEASDFAQGLLCS